MNHARRNRRTSATGIEYQTVVGDLANPWIVFTTGLTLNGDFWRDWDDYLSDDYNLCYLDVPGYGASKVDKESLDARGVDDWAGYILAMLDEVGVDSGYLVAEQTGGAASLYTMLTRPERVRAAVLIATPFHGRVIQGLIGTYTDRASQGGIEAWSDYMMPLLFTGDEDSPLVDVFRRTHLANDLDVILHDGASWSAVDLTAHLANIQTPILILAPGASPIIPREHAFEMEERLPNASMILFGARGQLLAFTDAPSCAFITRRFLNRHESQQASDD